MKYEIRHGTIGGKYFVVSFFDDEGIIFPLRCGLKRFFEDYETSKLKEKTKKETDQGYFSIPSSSSSGCRR